MTRAKSESLLRPKQIAMSVAACFALHAAQLQANPTGPTVVHGGVGFSGLGTSALSITNQAGGNAIINWNGFSIGVNELTRFQQFANLAVLNRVTGNDLSSILGALQSDGRVFLINPNGIVFGASARVDVAGMVASSLNLSDQDFLANRLRFTEVPGAGAVVNNGVIQTAAGGRVYMVAPSVENNGLIQSPQGAIVLAAGREIELVDANSPYLTVKVAAAAGSAVNVGNLVADSGRIGMFGALVRNSGTVEAGGAMVGPGGEIRLVASKDLTLGAGSLVAANGTSGGKVLLQAEGGTNLVAGTVEAKGRAGAGGEVNALGVRVGVVGHGVIDASGDTGGGTVRVGGDYQGKDAAVQNAKRTYIGTDGVIRADAGTTGDGGRVIVWADGDTRFFGSISARGGSQSGNGGFVETSGKELLQSSGVANVGAASGKGGMWLLDPDNVDIVAGSGADDALAAYGIVDFFAAYGTTSSIGVNGLMAGISYGSSVDVAALNNITLNTSIDVAATPGDLTLRAGNNINLGSNNITTAGKLHLSAADFGAGVYGNAAGAITSNAGFGNIATNGKDFDANGASVALGSINTSGVIDAGTVSINATSGNVATGGITTGGGSVFLSAAYGAISVGGMISTSSTLNPGDTIGNGSVFVTANGNITTGSIVTASPHPVDGGGGNVRLGTTSGIITVNGTIDTRGAQGSLVPVDTCNDGCFNTFAAGTDGGNVRLVRTAQDGFTGTAVAVNGDILTKGGDGANGTSLQTQDHSGGSGGLVLIGGDDCGNQCTSAVSRLAGSVSINGGNGVINASGGDGGTITDAIAGTSGGSGGQVSIWSYGSIGVGAIVARGGNAGDGADGGAYGNYGAWGGYLNLQSDAGSVAVGSIDASGGSGGNAGDPGSGSYSIGGSGGSAGYMNIRGAAGIDIGSIVGRGANGGAGGKAGGYLYAYGGDGGEGNSVNLSSSSGTVSIGSMDTTGAHGGAGGVASDYAWGGQGGSGGYVDVSAMAFNISSIVGRGGNGGAGGTATGGSFPQANGGYGGRGVNVYVSVTGSVSIGSVDFSGGHAGAGGTADQYAWGGGGGYAGNLNVYADSIGIGSITGRGADGGTGGTISDSGGYSSGGMGGAGGSVYLNASSYGGQVSILGPISTGKIDVSGGNGGNSGAVGTSWTIGGSGGNGGYVNYDGSTINVKGPIFARGGNGGNMINSSILAAAGTPDGGSGGFGGSVNVFGSGEVQINVGGTLGAVAIDVSGGMGGSGHPAASPAGNGGAGGGGGSVDVVGTPDMTLFGSVIATGGAGGAGGAGNATNVGGAGGAGGNAGFIFLDASSSASSQTGDGIIFVLAGTQFNVQGGSGGAGGVDGGAGAGAGGIAGSTNTFISMSDYFGTIVVLDPLSLPAVNSAFQQVVNGSDDSTVFVGGEDDKDKDENKSKKEFGSCKS